MGAPRNGADIDLLVRPGDRSRVAKALAGIAVERDQFGPRSRLRELAFEQTFLCRRPVSTALDVHSHLTYPDLYAIDAAGLWQRSRRHPGFDSDWLRVLAVEDMLLHLALHAFYDLKGAGRHDFDALRLIAENPVDWSTLVQRAADWGATVPLYMLLARVAGYRGTWVPEQPLAHLRPGALRLQLAQRLLAGAPKPNRADLPVSAGIRVRQLLAQLFFSRSTAAGLAFQWRYLRARLGLVPRRTAAPSVSADPD